MNEYEIKSHCKDHNNQQVQKRICMPCKAIRVCQPIFSSSMASNTWINADIPVFVKTLATAKDEHGYTASLVMVLFVVALLLLTLLESWSSSSGVMGVVLFVLKLIVIINSWCSWCCGCWLVRTTPHFCDPRVFRRLRIHNHCYLHNGLSIVWVPRFGMLQIVLIVLLLWLTLSNICICHQRPFPLKGRFYVNIFIHFEPMGRPLSVPKE